MNKHMSYQSQDELIAELHKLQHKYDSQMELYEKNIESNQVHEESLSKLNKFSVDLLNLSTFDNLEVLISKMIKDITDARASVFSNYDSETKTLNVQHVELEHKLLEKVIGLLGKPVKNIQAPVSEEIYQLMTTEVIGIRETLHEASFGSISRPVGAAIQKLLNVNRFFGIVYVFEGRLYGTSLLAMGRNQPDPPRKILENIIFLASVTLKRKKAEEIIKESEERFRVIFENAPDAIFLTDPITGKILDANTAASILLAKKQEQIIGMNQFELHPQQPADKINEFLDSSHPIESYILRSDGNLVPVEITSQIILFKGQHVLMGSFRDITERKLTESVMQQVLTEFQTLIENVQQGVLLEDESRKIRFSNKKFCNLFSINSPDEIFDKCGIALAQNLQQHFADPQGFLKTVDIRLSENNIVLSEELCLADGRTFERDYIPVIVDGKKTRNYWIYRDITERKQAEMAMIASKNHISALVQAIPDMIFIQNSKGVYIDYHSSDNNPLYVSPNVFLGKNMNEVLPAETALAFQKVFETAFKTKLVQNFEYSLKMGDETCFFESRTLAYESNRILSLVRDITERKQDELKIQIQNEELKRLNEDKDRFMSILAHDLKSPFNSILGLLDLLQLKIHNYDIDKIEKMIGIIKKSSYQYYQLLESLLLWARSHSGKMPFDPQKVIFSETSNLIIEELKLGAEAKNIEIDFLPGEECIVLVDMEMLKTILRNLVTNAIKYTNHGGKINIYCENCDDKVTIVVSDNGIGIEPDNLKTLFNISLTHSEHGTAGETGTGLGLFLCKELIEKNNGIIWVESEPNKGSDFKFTLPQYKADLLS